MRNASRNARVLLPTFIVGATCSIIAQSELTCSVMSMNGREGGVRHRARRHDHGAAQHDRERERSIDVAFDEVVEHRLDRSLSTSSRAARARLVRRARACVLTFEIVYARALRPKSCVEASATKDTSYLCECGVPRHFRLQSGCWREQLRDRDGRCSRMRSPLRQAPRGLRSVSRHCARGSSSCWRLWSRPSNGVSGDVEFCPRFCVMTLRLFCRRGVHALAERLAPRGARITISCDRQPPQGEDLGIHVGERDGHERRGHGP